VSLGAVQERLQQALLEQARQNLIAGACSRRCSSRRART
jgi:hypothetical protein